jgi:integrase
MARHVNDARLESRHSRGKLPVGPKPHYKQLIAGHLHIGYRRRRKGEPGRWLTRVYVGKDAKGIGRYHERDIALADDLMASDGVTILNFSEAQAAAFERFGGDQKSNGPLTVGDAIVKYLKAREDAGGNVRADRQRAALHILPTLGSELVDALTAERLRGWLANIASEPPRARQKVGGIEPNYRKASGTDDDAKRRRRSTSNRVLTILKAALNHAFEEGHAASNAAWGKRLKPFEQADAARQRHLSVDECKRLVNACGDMPEFRNLVIAALQTGCRYGELVRLKVADFDGASCTLAVWISKSGKSRRVHLSREGCAFFKSITAGRAGDEPMLPRPGGVCWGSSEQSRPMAAAVARAKIKPSASFHSLRHSYASLALMNGVPMPIVSKNLGHADQRMVERHYGHYADEYLKKAIQAGAQEFGFEPDKKVVPL